MNELDFRALDQEIATLVRKEGRFRESLPAGGDGNLLPLEVTRIAKKSTLEALRELKPSAHDLEWREGILAWCEHFILLRYELPLLLEYAEEKAAQNIQLSVREESGTYSYREVAQKVLAAGISGALPEWITPLRQGAGRLLSLQRRREETRNEIRAKIGSPPRTLDPALVEFALQLLKKTGDVASATMDKGARGLAPFIQKSMAIDAREGWPPRLTSRWLQELFPTLTQAIPKDWRLPRVISGTSFALALEQFGQLVREAPDPRPFALHRAPHIIDVNRIGVLFGQLPAQPIFNRKMLLMSESAASSQARAMSVAGLLETRRRAASFLVSRARMDAGELSSMLVQDESASELLQLRESEASECDVQALATAPELAKLLVDRFDEDWFRNPKGLETLFARRMQPGSEKPEIQPLVATALAREFERVLA